MVTTKQQILDIAMNLNRIGNWAADGYEAKQKRILLFLDQTNTYVATLDESYANAAFSKTINVFKPIFQGLYTEGQTGPANVDSWAERCMTWGNILTHRASLLS